jgi:hypothetical protein
MRKYKFLSLLILAFIAFSCEQNDPEVINACGIEDPAENLPWLKAKIESFEEFPDIYKYMYVQQGTYLGQTVFLVGNCCPLCDAYFPVYNCEGDEIMGVALEVTNLKTIWKPVFSACTL